MNDTRAKLVERMSDAAALLDADIPAKEVARFLRTSLSANGDPFGELYVERRTAVVPFQRNDGRWIIYSPAVGGWDNVRKRWTTPSVASKYRTLAACSAVLQQLLTTKEI